MICWFLGHSKEYVAICNGPKLYYEGSNPPETCEHGYYFNGDSCNFCKKSGQLARWICRRKACRKMGTDTIKPEHGLFTIEFGALVPDVKAWSNFDGPLARSGRGEK